MGWLCPVLHCAGRMDGAGGIPPPSQQCGIPRRQAGPGWAVQCSPQRWVAQVLGQQPVRCSSRVWLGRWGQAAAAAALTSQAGGLGASPSQCRDWGGGFCTPGLSPRGPLLPLWPTALPAKGPCLLGLICSVPAPCLVSCFLLGITLMPLIGLF